MSDLYEDLSRLLDGDLSAEEAASLRQRIEQEPEVASAWAHVRSAADALDALPLAIDPPAALDAAVVGPREMTPSVPSRAAWAVAAVGWIALAASLLLFFRPDPPSSVAIGVGSSELDGAFHVLIGDVVVDLDGRARIDVEPLVGVVRGEGQEVDMNTRTAILAGLAGAAITVTVYEGRAAVLGPDDPAPVELDAGSAHTVAAREAANDGCMDIEVIEGGEVSVQRFDPHGKPCDPLVSVDAGARQAALRGRVEELTAELASIEDELATERFAGRLRDAELQRIQGVPSEWSDQVPAVLRPEVFEDEVLPLTDMPGFTVEDVDCGEFPCIAALRYDGDDETLDWGSDVGEKLSTWSDANLDDASLTINKSVFQDDDSRSRYLIFSIHDGDPGDDIGQRTDARMDDLVDDLGERNREGDAPTP